MSFLGCAFLNQHGATKPQAVAHSMAGAPKNTGRFAPGNPGKPKGATNKLTRDAKVAIALAAEGLGGTDRLIEWAKEDAKNEFAFWSSIYPKLIPVAFDGGDENGIKSLTVTFK